MLTTFKRMFAAAPVASSILVIALVLSLFFGVRAAVFWANGPARIAREQPVAAWMTPRYVSHSWKVPREVVAEALSLDRQDPPRQSLAQLAEARGIPVEALIATLEQAITGFRAEEDARRPPQPPAPDAPRGPDAPPEPGAPEEPRP